MPWNGSGTFTRNNGTHSGATTWQQDDAAGTGIEANVHDTHDEDMADGIDNCLAKDGQNAMTGDLDMGNNDINSVGPNSFVQSTWTPALVGGTTPGTTTYTARYGTYTKVGPLVLATFSIYVNTISGGTGSAHVTGLPFGVQTNTDEFYGVVLTQYSGITLSGVPTGLAVQQGGSPIISFLDNDAGTASVLLIGAFGGSETITGSVMYRTGDANP